MISHAQQSFDAALEEDSACKAVTGKYFMVHSSHGSCLLISRASLGRNLALCDWHPCHPSPAGPSFVQHFLSGPPTARSQLGAAAAHLHPVTGARGNGECSRLVCRAGLTDVGLQGGQRASPTIHTLTGGLVLQALLCWLVATRPAVEQHIRLSATFVTTLAPPAANCTVLGGAVVAEGDKYYKTCRGREAGMATPQLRTVQLWRSCKPRQRESVTVVTQLSLDRWGGRAGASTNVFLL